MRLAARRHDRLEEDDPAASRVAERRANVPQDDGGALVVPVVKDVLP
jgi:hypothetical protein